MCISVRFSRVASKNCRPLVLITYLGTIIEAARQSSNKWTTRIEWSCIQNARNSGVPALNRRDIFICVICVFVIKSTNQAKVALSRCFAGEDRKCKSSLSLSFLEVRATYCQLATHDDFTYRHIGRRSSAALGSRYRLFAWGTRYIRVFDAFLYMCISWRYPHTRRSFSLSPSPSLSLSLSPASPSLSRYGVVPRVAIAGETAALSVRLLPWRHRVASSFVLRSPRSGPQFALRSSSRHCERSRRTLVVCRVYAAKSR